MTLRNYRVCRVHPISGREIDTGKVVELSEAHFSARTELGKALRTAGVLPAGVALEHLRREGERVVVFPRRGPEKRFVLMPVKAPASCELCGGDPCRREGSNCPGLWEAVSDGILNHSGAFWTTREGVSSCREPDRVRATGSKWERASERCGCARREGATPSSWR